ncbi:Lrp/AsnC family transcriptional regulator [Raineyella fluvialis]|uniref:Winged helix-turn-helix transcriptional regulator n=1 Tax=Raineyella fluvialis TaxID=2662261 RepID=A0A5Q2FCR2_9ACTN|nr:Lrp/AsnC family transcriptional regulator [Raineyella fluvialis]QGF24568.1 winged helix-turn-helix transcriptional regulator [Raineyella fluvialis]
MDLLDREILSQLQGDGRLTLTELAGRVGLSVSPCHRRLRALEHEGVITGYHAQLDPAKVGLTFEALVFVTMDSTSAATVAAFETAVVAVPHVIRAERLFGSPDYLLRIIAADLPDYQRLWDTHLATLPGVRRLESTIVMKTLVRDRGLPLTVTDGQ